ncbi:hypothetical protein TNCV_4526471 [Trichonephila clavipes]|nr:hypothetical protein TNCV_4526471 [Trichonephila clavipes]
MECEEHPWVKRVLVIHLKVRGGESGRAKVWKGSSLVASGTWELKSGQSSSREPPSALCKVIEKIGPALQTTKPHQQKRTLSYDIFHMHQSSARWVFSGTGAQTHDIPTSNS